MSEHQSKYNNIITLGDFNLHVNDLQDADAGIFLGTLMGTGLTQQMDASQSSKGCQVHPIFEDMVEAL